MIPQQDIDKITDLNIVDVIGEYIELKRKGANYFGKCPFHGEKTGSFSVSPEKNIFKCFGCAEKGNGIGFVMKHDKLEYIDAVRKIASMFRIPLSDSSGFKKPSARLEKNPLPIEEMFIQKKKFTKWELSLLGRDVTEELCEKQFDLFSVEYYITKTNDEGVSWKISSTDDFPIYVYDYGTWGKIYQPLSSDYRFSYFGEKPDSWIFADNKTAKLIEKARKGELPVKITEDGEVDDRLADLIMCSGPSDALNVRANGFNVCWMNSETADLDDYDYKKILRPICKEFYILYDLDETGMRQANKIALRYLDVRIIWLPEDLQKFKDRKGNTCKDAKDFFMYYRSIRHKNIPHYFKLLVQTSLSLQFWMMKTDKKSEFVGYDINNEQMYGFLNAVGLYTLPSKQERKGFTYVYIQDNIVRQINEEQMQSFVNHLLIKFIKENLEYYNISLINAIHRSNQVKLASLEKIRKIELDFKSYGIFHDFLFFRNSAVKITDKGINEIKLDKVDKCTWDFKIIDHDFKLLDSPFEVTYTSEYKNMMDRFKMADPHALGFKELKKEHDEFDELNKYDLNLKETKFSLINYVYNTGRVHWKKREAGEPLTEKEKKEEDLHFINKCAALGYMIYRYKDPSRAYMVYGMETEQSTIGKHLGGTGKSVFFSLVEKVRNMASIDGQKRNMADNDTLFSDVKENVTEFVYFDDLNKNMDLHLLMPMITGKMEVRALYANKITLDFANSPKVGITSNHAVANFDASLRRRTWFIAFSNYYHSEDKLHGVEERSPRTEFGKNLLLDYTDEEMNKFYNFMAWCMYTYLKFRVRINPPMQSIEQRNIQRILGDEFIYWADDYLSDDKLNINLEKTELFEAYKKTMPAKFADMVKMRTFKEKLQVYCEFKNYIFNPTELLKTESERDRNEIRDFRDNKDLYFFHIKTSGTAPAPQKNDLKSEPSDGKPF